MGLSLMTEKSTIESILQDWEGVWESVRQYYDLEKNKRSLYKAEIQITFLKECAPELNFLRVNCLSEYKVLCGSKVVWVTKGDESSKTKSKGTMIFGATTDLLIRDRGFGTLNPVLSDYKINDGKSLVIFSAYGGQTFKETISNLNENHRTRQTEIFKDDKLTMVGQYIESRINQTKK